MARSSGIEDDLEVCYVRLEKMTGAEFRGRCEALLCSDERKRWHAIRSPEGKLQFLVGRALLRSMLSDHSEGVEPTSWEFQTNKYGRPEIQGVLGADLRFNVSHTRGLAACAVARSARFAEVGLDVEDLNRPVRIMEIAERFFSPSEVADLRRFDRGLGRKRWFEYWTLKEAFTKALGRGLSLPLHECAFELNGEDAPRLVSGPPVGDDAKEWRFFNFYPTPQHIMAIAFRAVDRAPLQIRLRQVVPLSSRASCFEQGPFASGTVIGND